MLHCPRHQCVLIEPFVVPDIECSCFDQVDIFIAFLRKYDFMAAGGDGFIII